MKTKPTLNMELILSNNGYKYIIGVDEAGRGPLMGPVVAAAVHITEGFDTSEINDSKKLSEKKREKLYDKLMAECDCAFFSIDNFTVDAMNILEATKMAMTWAMKSITKADYALIDGNFIPDYLYIPAHCVVGGDSKSVSIAAASIIAKVTRDRMVMSMHKQYPIYGWNKNKGYGTKQHCKLIAKYGPCSYHRKTFGKVKEYV